MNFIGDNGFVWWIGIIENTNDPIKLGRCQVRMFGIHSDNKSLAPTNSLPWCQPSHSPNTSLLNSTPNNGTLAFGFFLDGNQKQHPVIMGILPTIPDSAPNGSLAFNDSRTDDELKQSPVHIKSIDLKNDGTGANITNDTASTYPNRLNEPETSRLYRNESIANTVVSFKSNNVVSNVPGVSNGLLWSEPKSTYNTKYPYNNVLETKSGHVLEFDDTLGHERININHRSGSFIEFNPDGSKVEKIVKNNYEIIYSDNYVYILGKAIVTTNGVTEVNILNNANIHIKNDLNLSVDGNYNLNVKGNISQKSNEYDIDTPITKTTGKINAANDVTAGSISLQNHLTSGVRSGSDTSGKPI